MTVQIGHKVLVEHCEQDGFGEVVSYPDGQDTVEVAYYVSPVRTVIRRVPQRGLIRAELPSQTRCYYADGAGLRIGRILTSISSPNGYRYRIYFPTGITVHLSETDFHVR